MLPSDPDRLPDDLQDVARLLRDNRPEASGLELDSVMRQVRTRATRPSSSSSKGSTSMKSRIAMTAMLVSGLLMSGTGAGLAVSGLDATNNAASDQYRCDTPGQPACTTTTTTTTTPVAPPTTPPLPCDRNNDGRVDGNEDMNGEAPGCEMDDGSQLPNSVASDPTCDENRDGVISVDEAAKNGCGEVAAETDAGTDPTSSDPDEPTSREQAAQPARQAEASSDDELPFTGFAAIPILVGGIALLGGGLVLRRRTV